MLLLAAFGSVQYLGHAQLLWAHRAGLSPDDGAALQRMLAWDIGYLLAAFALIVLCAGCILRQAWARAAARGLRRAGAVGAGQRRHDAGAMAAVPPRQRRRAGPAWQRRHLAQRRDARPPRLPHHAGAQGDRDPRAAVAGLAIGHARGALAVSP